MTHTYNQMYHFKFLTEFAWHISFETVSSWSWSVFRWINY